MGTGSYRIGGDRLPMLLGEVDHGLVTLLDCERSGFAMRGGGHTNNYRVGTAAFGVHLDSPDEKWIRRVEVHLPALVPLLGENPVQPTNRLSQRSRRVHLALNRNSRHWKEGARDVIWDYRLSAVSDDTSLKLEMEPTMTLTDARPQSLKHWIDDWVAPLNSVVQVLVGAKSNPTSIRVWQKKHLSGFDRVAASVVIVRRGVGEHEPSWNRDLVIDDADIVGTNPGGVRDLVLRAAQLEIDHPVFTGLLWDSLNYPDRPLHNRFLDLIAALEAFDTIVQGSGPIGEVDFRASKAQALAAAKAAALPPLDVRFLKRWLPSRSSYSLEDRLRRLARGAGALTRWQVSPTEVARLRNGIAHGHAGLDGSQLSEAFDQSFELARRLVLLEYGLSPSSPT